MGKQLLGNLRGPAGPAGSGSGSLGGTATSYVAPKVTALQDGVSIAVDLSLGNDFRVTIAGNRTVAVPTNAVDGETWTIWVKQDPTGGRSLTWTSGNGGFSFGDGSVPALSATAGATDQISFRFNATINRHCYCGIKTGF